MSMSEPPENFLGTLVAIDDFLQDRAASGDTSFPSGVASTYNLGKTWKLKFEGTKKQAELLREFLCAMFRNEPALDIAPADIDDVTPVEEGGDHFSFCIPCVIARKLNQEQVTLPALRIALLYAAYCFFNPWEGKAPAPTERRPDTAVSAGGGETSHILALPAPDRSV